MKPKGKTPSLISACNGKPTVAVASRKSTCKRCNCAIVQNEECFVIPHKGSGFTIKNRYCKSCFTEIIDQTQKDLNELKELI